MADFDDTNPLTLLTLVLNEAFQTGAEISDDGALHLSMADDLSISVVNSPDGRDLVFYAPLADLLRGRSMVLMAAALAANLHQERTRGGAIGADMSSQELVFSWRMPTENVQPEQLVNALENFCNTAAELRTELHGSTAAFTDDELATIEQRATQDASLDEEGALDSPGVRSAATITAVWG